jgi:membrane protein required for colicin V production
MNITTFDWITLAIVLLSMALGAWRGLVHEVLAVIGWIASFLLAWTYGSFVGYMVPTFGLGSAASTVVGFVIVFIATIIACSLLTWLIKKMIESVGLRPVDRTLGAAFGILRGLVILLALTTVVLMTPLKNGAWWQQSAGAGALSNLLKGIKPVLPAQLGQYIQAAASSRTFFQFHLPNAVANSPSQGYLPCVES